MQNRNDLKNLIHETISENSLVRNLSDNVQKLDNRVHGLEHRMDRVEKKLDAVAERLDEVAERQHRDSILNEARDHKMDLILEKVISMEEKAEERWNSVITPLMKKVDHHDVRISILEADKRGTQA